MISMPEGFLLTAFYVLSVIQVAFYRVSSKQALRTFGFLGFFYFFLFALTRGLIVFCLLFSMPFCEAPLFFLTVLILFQKPIHLFPQFESQKHDPLGFYLFSAIWTGTVWLAFLFYGNAGISLASEELYLRAFLWSVFPASVFPVLSGIRERLGVFDSPQFFEGLPIYLIASGIFFLTNVFFWGFIN